MKFVYVLLLIILAGNPWTACHASRKMLMVRMKTEGKDRLFLIPRKVLTEAVDEESGMETELILTDDTDDEKPDVLINAEKKRLKQQKDPLMEALEEKSDEEAKPQNPRVGEATLSTSRGGDLVPKEDKKEKWVQKGPQKREHNGGEALLENDSFSLVTGDKLQIQVGGRSETKKEEAVVDDEKPEEEHPASPEVKEVIGFSSEASPANTAEMTKEADGSAMIVREKEDAQTVSAQKKHQASKEIEVRKKKDIVDDTLEPQKLENGYVSEDVNSKSSDDVKTKQLKKKTVTAKKVVKGSAAGGYKSSVSDDKDLMGEAMMDGRRMTKLNANEGEEEGKDNVKPFKKRKTLKKPLKDDLQEGDASDLEGVIAIDNKPVKTRVKKMKDSEIELDVTNFYVGDSVDLQSKPIQAEDTGKVKPKTKKKDKLKDKKSYKKAEEDSSDGSEQEEKPQGKVKEKAVGKGKEKTSRKPKKEERPSQNDRSSNKAEKKKQSTSKAIREGQSGDGNGGEVAAQDGRILEVVDRKGDTPVKGKDDAKEKPMEEEPLTMEKQEEKLEIEIEGIAKEAQENAEEFNSVLKSSWMEGADEDDEYSEFMQDFSDLSTKFHDTALKVADHLGPNIQKFTDTSKTYFNKANQHITKSFSPIVGKQFAPFLASLVSYGLLLVPLVVVILLFEHIRAMLSLQKVLLSVNIYLAAYFATLLLATFIMGEPMTFFYKSSASGYIHLQLLQALGYIIYVILQTIDMASSCSAEACSVKVTVVLQWFVAVTIGFHYYVTVFHRAMAMKGPHTNWKIYGIYSTAFLVLCLFARIKRVKKGYVQIGQEDTDKKH